jgi:hypothetical protein
LNSASDTATSSAYWNNTAPTSSVFTINNDGINHKVGTSNRYIAYCWAEVPGYSSIGYYIGNGSTDGPFVYTGFRPAFVLIKRSDSSNYWIMMDSSRSAYNPVANTLYPNDTNTEGAQTPYMDLVSNGFKLRDSWVLVNSSGANYVYMAFAEHPFGGANVSPSPAR